MSTDEPMSEPNYGELVLPEAMQAPLDSQVELPPIPEDGDLEDDARGYSSTSSFLR